jgi:hypothetical protein
VSWLSIFGFSWRAAKASRVALNERARVSVLRIRAALVSISLCLDPLGSFWRTAKASRVALKGRTRASVLLFTLCAALVVVSCLGSRSALFGGLHLHLSFLSWRTAKASRVALSGWARVSFQSILLRGFCLSFTNSTKKSFTGLSSVCTLPCFFSLYAFGRPVFVPSQSCAGPCFVALWHVSSTRSIPHASSGDGPCSVTSSVLSRRAFPLFHVPGLRAARVPPSLFRFLFDGRPVFLPRRRRLVFRRFQTLYAFGGPCFARF